MDSISSTNKVKALDVLRKDISDEYARCSMSSANYEFLNNRIKEKNGVAKR
jgi:hypothetical protein